MDKQINNFVDYLKIERNYAVNTQKAYARDLAKLLAFVHTQNLKKWSDLTAEHLNLFVMQMRNKSVNVSSIRRCISAVRGLLTYLLNNEQLEDNCAVKLRMPKITQKLPNVLDYDQLLLMLKPKTDSWSERRDIAIIEIIYTCALRVSELVGINIEDLDLQQGFLRIMGKGSKVRYTPIGRLSQQAIKHYLSIPHTAKALFVNKKKQRISVTSVQIMIKKRALDAGIKFNVYPHMLRHAAATHFLRSSHDLRATQEFLGHRSIKSTQVYIHLDFLELSKVYDNCHPRAKKT